MSDYVDFAFEFPKRCGQLLRHFEAASKDLGREVTFLISIASAGLIIPLERLELKTNKPHVTGDRATFAVEADEIANLLNKPFSSSSMCGDHLLWIKGQVKDLSRLPDEWEKGSSAGQIHAGKLLKIIRNALAHGNIWTRGENIETIVFASEVRDEMGSVLKHDFVETSPKQFSILLKAWFELLEKQRIGTSQAARLLDAA